MDPKVVGIYKGVGRVLEQHRSGQLPKAFKIIPTLRNWEEILWLTSPHQWTPAAMFAATRLFASNLNERMAQRFYHMVLLPAVEDNIDEHGKLNYHYYQALTKAAFKPAAFYRGNRTKPSLEESKARNLDLIIFAFTELAFLNTGILIPLCTTACSLRKATIFASVLAKTSIPMLHSAVALMKIAEMSYSGVASLFIRVLCDKKYAMPHRVIDALVAHFVRTAGPALPAVAAAHYSRVRFTTCVCNLSDILQPCTPDTYLHLCCAYLIGLPSHALPYSVADSCCCDVDCDCRGPARFDARPLASELTDLCSALQT